MTLFLKQCTTSSELENHLQSLLEPIHDHDLCGPSLRYDPIFTEIRMAREEDDPSLPMRQWERPLKKANWALIESLCVNALTKQSKDLQLVVWLTEAWMRLHGLNGLAKGLALLFELSSRFWDSIHPEIENGDSDARVAPYDWLSESLSLSLKVHNVLFTVFERQPSRITLAEWNKLISEEVSEQDPLHQKPQVKQVDEQEVESINRAEILTLTRHPSNIGPLLEQLQVARESQKIVNNLKAFLDEKLGLEAPNFNKMLTTLAATERVLETMTGNLKNLSTAPQVMSATKTVVPPSYQQGIDVMQEQNPQPPSQALTGHWHTREEAYATLEAVAAYLQTREPHSPTPYMIKKAVRWGRLPLPELMQEIMREEGDLNRMSKLFSDH